MTTPGTTTAPVTPVAPPPPAEGAAAPSGGEGAVVPPVAAAPVVPAVVPQVAPAVVDPKAAEAAAAEAAKAAAIEVKFPADYKADEALMGQFKPLAKELGLDSPKAQKLVDLMVGHEKAQRTAIDAELSRIDKGWTEQLKADPDFGGAKFDENVQTARKAMVRFGGEDLEKRFAALGVQNDPVLVKAFHRIGKAIAEDSIAGTTTQAAKTPATSDEAHYRALYTKSPQMFPKE